MRFTFVLLGWLLVAAPAFARGWLGVRLLAHSAGIGLDVPSPGSPAERAGLRRGDVIVSAAGVDFSGAYEAREKRFRERLSKAKPGETLALEVLRRVVDKQSFYNGKPVPSLGLVVPERFLVRKGGEVALRASARDETLAIAVELGTAPDERPLEPGPPADRVFPGGVPGAFEPARALIADQGAAPALAELTRALARERPPDQRFRLARQRFALEHPLQLPGIARALAADLSVARPGAALAAAGVWGDAVVGAAPRVKLGPKGLTLDQRIQEVLDVLARAKRHLDRALARLTPEEQDYIAAHEVNLSRTLARHIYVHHDVAAAAAPAHFELVRLLEKVDRAELNRAAAVLAAFVEDARGAFREDLARELKVPELRRDTPFGPLYIGGPGHNWYHEDAAVIVDLGGADFYTHNAGGARGRARPLALVIDFEGDDAYESTTDWCQGAGLLGVGVLADLGGHDAYLGSRWCQGAGLAGVGILFDVDGNDSHHAQDFGQGVAFAGTGLLIDVAGTDTYDAARFAQACALPGGVAALIDGEGRDTYFAKARYQTSYGDRGLFDAYSQGCALGLREIAAGGIAALVDGGGDDRYEGGHFSQGGGYYHGFGLLADAAGDDWYMGSRYAQAWAAHAAVGCLEDRAGNDRYGTRQCVAQGIAWDHCVVAFLDRGGDDVYEGGDVSSQGYAAYSSFSLFFDEAGNDIYRYADGPGTTGPNDPPAPSLAVFVDGGGKDTYPPRAPGEGRAAKRGQVGLFLDR